MLVNVVLVPPLIDIDPETVGFIYWPESQLCNSTVLVGLVMQQMNHMGILCAVN